MKYKLAVLKYEQARKLVVSLRVKRSDLISRCEKVDPFDFNSKICLVNAHNENIQMQKINNEYYSYREELDEGFLNGDYCENCHNSYMIKVGPLAEANKEFGVAKRRLSALGKTLMEADQ